MNDRMTAKFFPGGPEVEDTIPEPLLRQRNPLSRSKRE